MAAGMSAADVARELNRSEDWVRRNYGKLHRETGFPNPLLRTGGELVWDPIHFRAWKDRGLSPSLKRYVRTLRLAEAAIMAADGGIPSEVLADELSLSRRLGLVTEEQA